MSADPYDQTRVSGTRTNTNDRVLNCLEANGMMRRQELIAELRISENTITDALTTLDEAGKIVRRPHPYSPTETLVHLPGEDPFNTTF